MADVEHGERCLSFRFAAVLLSIGALTAVGGVIGGLVAKASADHATQVAFVSGLASGFASVGDLATAVADANTVNTATRRTLAGESVPTCGRHATLAADAIDASSASTLAFAEAAHTFAASQTPETTFAFNTAALASTRMQTARQPQSTRRPLVPQGWIARCALSALAEPEGVNHCSKLVSTRPSHGRFHLGIAFPPQSATFICNERLKVIPTPDDSPQYRTPIPTSNSNQQLR